MHKGKHQPIINRELFDEVQTQLAVAPRPPTGSKEFSFTRILKCGACKTGVTAEEHIKRLVTTGEVLASDPAIGIRAYAKYVLQESTKEEKR